MYLIRLAVHATALDGKLGLNPGISRTRSNFSVISKFLFLLAEEKDVSQ